MSRITPPKQDQTDPPDHLDWNRQRDTKTTGAHPEFTQNRMEWRTIPKEMGLKTRTQKRHENNKKISSQDNLIRLLLDLLI